MSFLRSTVSIIRVRLLFVLAFTIRRVRVTLRVTVMED